ncbi:MAG: DNA translocase FtsK [Candidatus Eisenbacteria bacterium]
MPRGPKPLRRWILGILLLSVSLLTALSLPSLGLSHQVGPFGGVWVSLWARAFGRPAVWCLSALGVLWASALLIPWRRPFLLPATLLILPLLIVCDAFLQSWIPAVGRPFWHGESGAFVVRQTRSFFGGSQAQTWIALACLALTATLCFFRWALPAPVGVWVGTGLGVAAAALLTVARWLARGATAGAALLLRLAWSAVERWRAAHARNDAHARAAPRGAGDGERAESPRDAAGLGKAASTGDERSAALYGDEAETAGMAGMGGRGPVAGDDAAELAPSLFDVRAARRTDGPDGGVAQPVRSRAARATSRRTPGAAGCEVPEPAEGPAVARLELLEERTDEGSGAQRDEIERSAALITQTLASFGIAGEVGEVHPGPVITRYEFVPGAGVTVSQISSRQDDLALALRTPRVRLLAPIPGKAAVGIEIPNRNPALISFREIASRREFREAREPLCVALGKDVAGRAFYASLEKMPHLLVAGTTGSGKSVCINSLIVSLLLRCSPEQLRLLLIDPKMLELTTYNEIPHLLRPVVTEAREAARALQWLTREMERRYRLLAGLGVRNIESYLKRRAEGRDDPALGAMPYIVVCVDELADLMLSNPAEIEVPIARLAQMARAVGIHLVLATQRPSVDVITGVIKANFPARIAFQVATRTDSRTILDMNGAESLVGRGDMLFIPPGKAQAHRIHGAFLSDAETERVATYLRQFPPAEELIAAPTSDPAEEGEAGFEDPLYHEALRIVVSTRQGSTSMLQRRLRVGYTRAGRLMDLLERAGVVGPPDGSRAREVLVSPEYLEEEARERPIRTG